MVHWLWLKLNFETEVKSILLNHKLILGQNEKHELSIIYISKEKNIY